MIISSFSILTHEIKIENDLTERSVRFLPIDDILLILFYVQFLTSKTQIIFPFSVILTSHFHVFDFVPSHVNLHHISRLS